MANYKFNLRDAQAEVKPSAQVETPIVFFVRWNGNKLKYPTGIKIHPKDWAGEEYKGGKKYQTVLNSCPKALEYNRKLSTLKGDAEDIFYENTNKGILSVEQFRELLDIKQGKIEFTENSLFSFIEKFIKEAPYRTNKTTGRIISKNTIKLYNNAFKLLKEFSKTKRKQLNFEHINLDFYHDFIEFLTTKKGFATNTIGRVIKDIKTFLGEATERGVNTNLAFKSRRFKVLAEKTDSFYLTDEELKDLYNYDLSENPRLEKVRDLFLVGCYTGLRFSDFTQIKPEHIKGNRITITTQKTDQRVVIAIHPVVAEIIKKYNGKLPEAISNQKTNDYLKEIAQNIDSLKTKVSLTGTRAGVRITKTVRKCDILSSHCGRRTFATNAYLQGLKPLAIMGITGHTTEAALMAYLKITPDDKAEMLELHWNKQNQLKVVS